MSYLNDGQIMAGNKGGRPTNEEIRNGEVKTTLVRINNKIAEKLSLVLKVRRDLTTSKVIDPLIQKHVEHLYDEHLSEITDYLENEKRRKEIQEKAEQKAKKSNGKRGS